jgi:predicted GNAT family acetyltransferase
MANNKVKVPADGAAALEVELRLAAGRFVATAAPDDAFLEFAMEQDGAVMNMTHTWTSPAARGRGFASKITLCAFQHCLAQGMKVRPSCTFISGRFLRKHPEFKDICV